MSGLATFVFSERIFPQDFSRVRNYARRVPIFFFFGSFPDFRIDTSNRYSFTGIMANLQIYLQTLSNSRITRLSLALSHPSPPTPRTTIFRKFSRDYLPIYIIGREMRRLSRAGPIALPPPGWGALQEQDPYNLGKSHVRFPDQLRETFDMYTSAREL